MTRVREPFSLLLVTIALMACAASRADVSTDEWQAKAEQALLSRLQDIYPVVSHWTIDPLLGKRQHARLRDIRDPRAEVTRIGKRSAVRLTWMHATKPASALVWFTAAGVQSVPTAKADLRGGAALAPELAEYAERDVLAVPCIALDSPSLLAGMRAKRAMRAGEVFCVDAIEPRPAVARGEAVTVISVAGAVTITAKGIAQQDGSVGQRLRVKNPSSGQTYFAAVSGEAEVTVYE